MYSHTHNQILSPQCWAGNLTCDPRFLTYCTTVGTPRQSLFLFMATPGAYGRSWARGRIRAAATGLGHSKPDLSCTASETYATACCNTGFLTHWARPGIETTPSGTLPNLLSHKRNSLSVTLKTLLIISFEVLPSQFFFFSTIKHWDIKIFNDKICGIFDETSRK